MKCDTNKFNDSPALDNHEMVMGMFYFSKSQPFNFAISMAVA